MRIGALLSVALLAVAVAAPGAPAHAGGGGRGGAGHAREGAVAPSARAQEARRRGRQVRRARKELTRANALERRALSGESRRPASDMERAQGLRERARARLKLIDRHGHDMTSSRSPRDHIRNARRHEASARELDKDPGAQALYRQVLADMQGEAAYWRQMGSYGMRPRQRSPQTTSRSAPRPTLRNAPYSEAAGRVRYARERARNRGAVRSAAEPSARRSMIRGRRLRYYETAFGDTFTSTLSRLGASDTWIDVGAGHGLALADYAERAPGGARVVAVDLNADASRQAARFPEGRFRVVQGDVTRARVGGKAQLLTDVFAAVSYGDAPDRVVRRYGELLEPGGRAMIFLEEQRNTVLSRDGRTGEDLVGYLRRVKGFEVEDVRVFNEGTAVLMRRTKDPVKAPRLQLLEFTDGGPPTRVFRMLDPGPAQGPIKSRFTPRPRG